MGTSCCSKAELQGTQQAKHHGESCSLQNEAKPGNPPTFKSKSFTDAAISNLEAYASAVNLKIGDDERDKNHIINQIIRDESEKCLVFASQNPEVSLPDSLDIGPDIDNGVCTPEKDIPNTHTSGGTADDVGGNGNNVRGGLFSLTHPFKIP